MKCHFTLYFNDNDVLFIRKNKDEKVKKVFFLPFHSYPNFRKTYKNVYSMLMVFSSIITDSRQEKGLLNQKTYQKLIII